MNGGKIMSIRLILLLFVLSSVVTTSTVKAIEAVDVELQLLIDISGSVDSDEYDLQMLGYQAAFESDNVQDAIVNGTHGKIAVQLIVWSGPNQQNIMIDWTLIDSGTSADAFAAEIGLLARPFSGWTAIGEAIAFSYPEFDTNAFEGTTQIIDVSGDGTNNSGMAPEIASQAAIDAGVDRINGIVITESQAVIDEYAENVIAGDGAFLLAPANFDDFQTAIENKIVAEISNTTPEGVVASVVVPEPPSFALLILAMIPLVVSRKKNGE